MSNQTPFHALEKTPMCRFAFLLTLAVAICACAPGARAEEPAAQSAAVKPAAAQPAPAAPPVEEINTEDWGSLPKSLPWARDGAEMVLVPAGEFTMGQDNAVQMEGKPHEGPAHKVWLSSYYVDKHEVTNAQYARFCEETGHIRPRVTRGLDLAGPDQPVVAVTYHDALAYAEWAGKDLPTEAQWEKAARGATPRVYPWGDDWVEGAANTKELGARKTMKPGSFPQDVSPFGAFDMAGNASEWVKDWFDRDYYSKSPDKNPTGPTDGGFTFVYRGGDYRVAKNEARTTNRRFRPGNQAWEECGFRCVRNLKIIPTPTVAPTMEYIASQPTPTPLPFLELEPELIKTWKTEGSLPIMLRPLNVGSKVPVTVYNNLPVDVSLSILSSEPQVVEYDRKFSAFSRADLNLAQETDMALYVKVPATGQVFRANPIFRSDSGPKMIIEAEKFLPLVTEPGKPAQSPAENPEMKILYTRPSFLWNRVTFFNASETTTSLHFDACPIADCPEGEKAPYSVSLGPKTAWVAPMRAAKHRMNVKYLDTFDSGAAPVDLEIDNRKDLRAVVIKENKQTNEKIRVFTRMLPLLECEVLGVDSQQTRR